MKALSGYAEWFWLLAKNWKDVENRDWPLYRFFRPMELPVRVYLHASKTPASREETDFIHRVLSGEQWDEFCAVDWNALRGTLFAKITFTYDVTEYNSPWFFGKHGFLAHDGVFLDKPIPYRGQLGFFKVPDEVVRRETYAT